MFGWLGIVMNRRILTIVPGNGTLSKGGVIGIGESTNCRWTPRIGDSSRS